MDNDQPGTVRTSSQHNLAILTNEGGDAPWFITERDGRRYWATNAHVKDWPLRTEGFPLEPR